MLLVIDNYDSFTYNLVQYFGELGAEIVVRRNDALSVDEIAAMAPDAIVISPGPCAPAQAGVSVPLIRALGARIPMLGVCLGHQAIGEAYGGRVVRAARVMHGKTSRIRHDSSGLFTGLRSPLEVMRYHSLIVEASSLPTELVVTATAVDAVDEIHALAHHTHPVWGVQFHPESILTREGKSILANFLTLAGEFARRRLAGVTAEVRRMQRLVILLAVLALLAIVGFFTVLAPIVDRRLNTVVHTGAPPPSAAAESLHAQLSIVDLHADALLWPRDLLARASHGHVDVPRLREGNVAIQVFSVVTKTPRGLNYDRNTAESDNITLLAAAQRYPFRAWNSLFQRALVQAAKLEDAERRSNGDLTIIRSSADLDAFLARRRITPRLVGGILATEGLHPIEGRLENLDSLAARGYRIFGLTHFFDNEVGGSAHGVSHGGLTAFGRQVISRMDSMSLIIDVAHASPQLIDDVLAASARPIIVSHTGVQATCPGPRNLTDDQLQRIAAKGGVVGIGYWDGAICEVTPASAAKAIQHAVRVAGEDHVALGSDFDGSTKEPFNAAGLSQLTDALKTAGLTDSQIGKVMGGNALYLLRRLLPSR